MALETLLVGMDWHETKALDSLDGKVLEKYSIYCDILWDISVKPVVTVMIKKKALEKLTK